MAQYCEACEESRQLIVENSDYERDPYTVCKICHVRLKNLALRPSEWFNLAKRHGWPRFLLHDDFYDDTGKAWQPEIDVVDAELFPSPTIEQASSSPDALLDWTITKWHFTPETVNAWRRFPERQILQTLKARISEAKNVYVTSRIIQVCAKVGLPNASELLKEGWRRYPEGCSLYALSEASAACLPFDEGYKLVVGAVRALDRSQQRDAILALAYFRSSKTLDWIEQHYFEPASENWGRLTILSSPNWARLKKWIRLGRPLSLVALDAMLELLHRRTPFVKEREPRIIDPPGVEELPTELTDYACNDSSPRVENAVTRLVANLEAVIHPWKT